MDNNHNGSVDTGVFSTASDNENEALPLSVLATHQMQMQAPPLLNGNTEAPQENIFLAIELSNYNMMLKYIHQRNEINEIGGTPLHFAAAAGFKPGIILLLAYNCCVDPIDYFGMTPLIRAIINRHLEAAVILMDAGASPYYFYPDSRSPLTTALASNQYALANNMLSRPCLKLYRQLALNYALRDAARLSDQNYAKLLLLHGADLEYPVSNAPHPLNISVQMGDLDMVNLWINAKSPLERRDRFGATPLMNAARAGFYEVVVALVMNGANVSAKNGPKTAFSYAIQSGHMELASFLLHCMRSSLG